MADIKVESTKIKGLYVIEPIIFKDDRGFLYEAYNEESLRKYGLSDRFVQDNEVVSNKGVLRGMHVNVKHPQAKLIRTLDGKIFDVVIDLRKDSDTYGESFSIMLSAENRKQLYIPEGMGHGYLAMSTSRVLFKTTTHYLPDDEIGFAWDSKEIKIKWPIDNPIQNERDKKNKALSEVTL